MTESIDRSVLLEIVARAAPPADRVAGGWCEPTTGLDDAQVLRRAAAWTAAATGGRIGLDGFLAARERVREAFLRGLCDVRVVDEAALPGWAHDFLALAGALEAADRETMGLTAEQWRAIGGSTPINDVLRPLLDIAIREVRSQARAAQLPLSPRAELRLAGVFGRRMARATVHVIDSELQVLQSTAALFCRSGAAPATASHLDGSATGWIKRFRRYPVLAYLVAVVYRNWRAFNAELCARLVGDRALIEQRIFAGAPLGVLDDVEGDAGDLHDHGRAVALLRFDSGRRVVYKPKDLRISAAFIDLVAFLNQDLELPLHTRVILPREGYTWESWVEHEPCRAPAEVRQFYVRLGMTLRLLQLLGARDFWLDNLVAAGAHPVFIDLEMAVQQAAELPTEGVLAVEQAALARLQETVVSMGVVAQGTPVGRGIQAEDFGALTPVRPFKSPFKSRYSQVMRSLITPRVDFDQTITWTKTDYAPTLDGRPAVPSEHFEEVLDGYRAMQRCLSARRVALLAEDGPIRRMARYPIRHIVRDTWSYIGFAGESVRTPLLVDGIQREMFFEGLMQPAFQSTTPDLLHVRKVASELESLRELDVGLFQALPEDTTLLSSDGTQFPGYFATPAIDLILARIDALDRFPLEIELDVIRSCFASGRHPAPRVPVLSPAMSPLPSPAAWLDEAVALADVILADAMTDASGALAWLGLVYHPDIDLVSVDVLRTEILSGTCGLAIVFADLFELTGLERFRDAAHGALASTLVPGGVTHMRRKMERAAAAPGGAVIMCGALYGFGAHIYSLCRSARALGAPALADAAMEFVRNVPLDASFRYSPLDFSCGLSGLTATLAPIAPDVAEQLGAHLVDRVRGGTIPPPPYPPEATALDTFPDAAGGILIALDRLSRAGLLQARRAELDDALRTLRAALVARDAEGRALLARLVTGEPSASGLGAAVAARLDEASASAGTARLFESIELAFAAHRRDPGAGHGAQAARFAGEFLRRRAALGSFFPDTHASARHCLSAVSGLGALVHVFTRLAHPGGSVPSLRIAE